MKKLLCWLDQHGEAAFIGVMVALMSIIMLVQTVMRYAFGAGFRWAEEIVCYFHIWCGFIGLSYCVRHNADMRVDISNILPPAVSKTLRLLSDAVLVVFYVFMCYTGIDVIRKLMESGQRSPAGRIPMWIVYAACSTGMFLALVRFIQRGILWFRKRNRKEVSEA